MDIDFKENLFDSDQEEIKGNEKLFSNESDNSESLENQEPGTSSEHTEKWKVLVVDDEEDVHSVTRMALRGFSYLNKEIQFLHTYSAKETKKILSEHDDIALIFLDVVMESNDAGLELVKHIRNKLNNNLTQIVLRTGYPGQAPEREVISAYEINDYKTKTELTTFKLFTVTLASLRAYNSMLHLENLRQTLEEKVKDRTAELEKKNIRIMEMDQMKTRFFANISHEFRSPLSLIIVSVEEMLLKDELNGKQRDYLEMVYRSANRILGLANQLLDLSKIDAGKLKINLIEYDIFKVIRRISRSYASLAERKKIKYKINIPEGSFISYFDTDKLEKILGNLLGNALKYTPEMGEVILGIKIIRGNKKGRKEILEMEISDSGPGIPSQLFNKIFDRFFQVEEPGTNTKQGTGIGLSLAKELIDLQYGTIRVNSKLNKGSRFVVQLPLGKDHLDNSEYKIVLPDANLENTLLLQCQISGNKPQMNDTDDIPDEEKPTVIIVEDNHDVLQHISEHFEEDFSVIQAENGKYGWERAQALIPDLIISDLIMPELDGRQLCEMVKKEPSTCHIPVILLTAKAAVEDRIKGLETGADDYITKPFNMDELITRAWNLIKQRKKLQEKFRNQTELPAAKISVTSADERFLKKTMEIVEQNISDCDFDVNSLYPEMHMSRMQLFRKFKALLNQTPGELIRNMRLNKAAQLIKQNYGNVAEVAFESGFNNLSYFAKCFREKYGVLPSEFGFSRR